MSVHVFVCVHVCGPSCGGQRSTADPVPQKPCTLISFSLWLCCWCFDLEMRSHDWDLRLPRGSRDPPFFAFPGPGLQMCAASYMGAGYWTQVPILARQAFYYPSHLSSPPLVFVWGKKSKLDTITLKESPVSSASESNLVGRCKVQLF